MASTESCVSAGKVTEPITKQAVALRERGLRVGADSLRIGLLRLGE